MEEQYYFDKCSEEQENGTTLNRCEDKEVITYCNKCKRVYGINLQTGCRTELNISLQDLLTFIKEKENEGYTN